MSCAWAASGWCPPAARHALLPRPWQRVTRAASSRGWAINPSPMAEATRTERPRARSSPPPGKLDKDVIAVKLPRPHGRPAHADRRRRDGVELTPIRATDADGLAVIRHSTAHVMADAVQRLFPGHQGDHRPRHRGRLLLRLRQARRRLHRGRPAPDRAARCSRSSRRTRPSAARSSRGDEAQAHVLGDGRDATSSRSSTPSPRAKRSASTSTARRPTSGSTCARGRTSRRRASSRR